MKEQKYFGCQQMAYHSICFQHRILTEVSREKTVSLLARYLFTITCIKKEGSERTPGERESTLNGGLFYLCCVGRAEGIMGDQLSKGVRFQQAYWPYNKHQLLFSFWFKFKFAFWLQLVLLFWKLSSLNSTFLWSCTNKRLKFNTRRVHG